MYNEYSWREKRLFIQTSTFPILINTGKTCLPSGNAHYSMYGITEKDANHYMGLNTKKHKLYKHYSSELVIDAETREAVEAVISICKEQDWTFSVYATGSTKTGNHIAIPREAEPSDHLYLRDSCFVKQYFGNIRDIDCGIYKPMHLIRGKGKRHEKTGISKHLEYIHIGAMMPTVIPLDISELLLRQVEILRSGYVDNSSTGWDKLLNALVRARSPADVEQGNRHTALWALSKDLYKSGVDHDTATKIASFYNSFFEVPHDGFATERAINQAYGSSGFQEILSY